MHYDAVRVDADDDEIVVLAGSVLDQNDDRSSEPELRLCDELGIAFLPWSPLGGIGKAGQLGDQFQKYAAVGEKHGVSPQQVALAWMLAKSPHVIPIPGASRPESIRDSAQAADLTLSSDELLDLG